jgi:hypothetical protein
MENLKPRSRGDTSGHTGWHTLALAFSLSHPLERVVALEYARGVRGVIPGCGFDHFFRHANKLNIVSSYVAVWNSPESVAVLGSQNSVSEADVHPSITLCEDSRVGFTRLELDEHRMVGSRLEQR